MVSLDSLISDHLHSKEDKIRSLEILYHGVDEIANKATFTIMPNIITV